MLWFLLSFGTAFFESTKSVSSKFALYKVDALVVSFATRFLAALTLLPMLLWQGVPTVDPSFWWVLAVGGLLSLLNVWLFMRALQASDMSLTMPLMSVTPLVLLLTSPLLVGELPNLTGSGGIVLIVIGTYVLNVEGGRGQDGKRGSFWAPFRALWTDKGARWMLYVAVLSGITTLVDKIGIGYSSALFWAVMINLVLSVGFLPLMLRFAKGSRGQMRSTAFHLTLAGVFNGLSNMCHMLAVELTLVAYVISVKRISALLSVLFGWLFFKEQNLKFRLIGAAIMIVGVVLIALA